MLLQQCAGLPSPTHCDAVNATAASRVDVADGIADHPGSLGRGGILRESLADMVCLSAGLVTPEIGIDAVLKPFVRESGSYYVCMIGGHHA